MRQKKLKITSCLDCPHHRKHPRPIGMNPVKCYETDETIAIFEEFVEGSVEIPESCPLEQYTNGS